MATTAERDRWMEVIKYEVWMLGETFKMGAIQAPLSMAPSVVNAISESRLLHARNLCDFCSPPWRSNDLKPSDLFDNYDKAAKYTKLQGLVDGVTKAYTTDSCPVVMPDGSKELHSPKWAFDKKLAHPTRERGISFDYSPFMNLVVPKLRLVVDVIGSLEKADGRDFPTLG